MKNQKEEKLEHFLNLLWLRPEQALFYVFKSDAFADLKFESPSLDISCGDGLFMFIHLGGRLAESFDRFQSTSASGFKHGPEYDIHDHFSEDYSVPVVHGADTKIDYGTDWKKNLLDKASKLDIYENLIEHDNNNIPLPFEDNYFRTIYSNSIYWVPEVENVLSDVRRIMHPDGTAVIEVMTPYLLETLGNLDEVLSAEAIAILDRNRRKTMPGSRTYKDWEALLLELGFKIENTKCVVPDKILTDIWNVGLRPISHLLIRMSDALSESKRMEIKREWVDLLMKLCKSMVHSPQTYSMERSPYISFELKK